MCTQFTSLQPSDAQIDAVALLNVNLYLCKHNKKVVGACNQHTNMSIA